jgi:hypothetical protein
MMDWQGAMYGETHLRSLRHMYKGLGFEVRLEEVKPEEVEECIQCSQENGERIHRVHGRRQQEAGNK